MLVLRMSGGSFMVEKINWIKDLVRAEQQMEESGMVEIASGFDSDRILEQDTIQFLQQLKAEFVDAVTAFNDLKPSALGRVKIYGIAKTQADFMLFRNGFKMIFSHRQSGVISIRFNFMGTGMVPQQSAPTAHQVANLMDEHLLEAKWGPFGEIQWTFQNEKVQVPYIVKYHMMLFIKESAK